MLHLEISQLKEINGSLEQRIKINMSDYEQERKTMEARYNSELRTLRESNIEMEMKYVSRIDALEKTSNTQVNTQ